MSKITSLGFEPKQDMRDGLTRLIEGYNGEG
jgi:nucleoside-diphosphate-sugar epimerase